MSQNNIGKHVTPQLNIKDIKDTYTQKNFQAIQEDNIVNNQLQGFKFFEFTFTKAVGHFRSAHSLGYIPQDIVVTKICGAGSVQFNRSLFSSTHLDMTVSDSCTIRFFVGSYWANQEASKTPDDDRSIFSGLLDGGSATGTDLSPSTPGLTEADIVEIAQEAAASAAAVAASVAAAAAVSAFAPMNVVSKASAYSILNTDDMIICSGASFSLTLYSAVSNSGKTIRIMHNGTNLSQAYTMVTTGGQTIGGYASGAYVLYTNQELLTLISDGTNWQILEHKAVTPWIDSGTTNITSTGSSPTKGAIVKDKLYWRRDGSECDFRIEFYQTGNLIGTGIYLLNYPTSLVMDTTNFSVSGAVNATYTLGVEAIATGHFSSGLINQNGGSRGHVWVEAYSTTQVIFHTEVAFTAAAPWGAGGNYGMNAVTAIGCSWRVPIVGWKP